MSNVKKSRTTNKFSEEVRNRLTKLRKCQSASPWRSRFKEDLEFRRLRPLTRKKYYDAILRFFAYTWIDCADDIM